MSETTSERTVHRSACHLCEAICGIEVTVANGKVEDIRGDRNDPLSRGHVCPKSTSLVDLYNDPDRLRRPMRRRGDTWEEIGWDEAIDCAARGLARVQKEHGRNSLAAYMGNPTAHSLGGLTHGLTFLSALGTQNRFGATSVDQLPQHVVSILLYGHIALLPIPDLDRTRQLLIFGANPLASNGSVMTAPDMRRRLREIRDRGGRVVLFDPRRTETAAVVDEHVYIRPGTDAVVLLAMLNVILNERSLELPRYVADIDDLRSAVAEFGPDVAASVSGVPAETIRRLALDFADSEAAVCYGRIGVSTQKHGTLCHWAIQVLNIVTGNLGREGGSMMTDPAVDLLRFAEKGHFGKSFSRVRGLPDMSGEFPVVALAEEISTPGDGQIRGLVTLSGNPVLSTPNGRAMDAALEQLDFMVSIDFYLNETTRHADVILPPVSALERDNCDLLLRATAVRNTAKYSPAVIPKSADARHDWEIFRDLGLAYMHYRAGSGLAAIRGRFDIRRVVAEAKLRLPPRMIVDLALRTGRYKLSVGKLLAAPSGMDLGPLRPGMEHRLRTADRRIHLLPSLIRDGLRSLRSEIAADTALDDDLPLRLIGRRNVRSNNSWEHNSGRLVAGPARHQLLIHPNDAARYGVANGPAQLRSRIGAIRVDVEQTTNIMEGTVSLPHGFGHNRPGVRLTVASKVAGESVNDITDPLRIDELCGTAAFSGQHVAIEPLPAVQ
ncbi:molybdopterin-dependent oxidoreductase [Nocardia sp. NPDC005825]|uniref:molybdopterin-dependent oxidoreductase n=1 Tax=unclassified Nocardia TaxID=2637762 RepID=UPI0033D07902